MSLVYFLLSEQGQQLDISSWKQSPAAIPHYLCTQWSENTGEKGLLPGKQLWTLFSGVLKKHFKLWSLPTIFPLFLTRTQGGIYACLDHWFCFISGRKRMLDRCSIKFSKSISQTACRLWKTLLANNLASFVAAAAEKYVISSSVRLEFLCKRNQHLIVFKRRYHSVYMCWHLLSV